MYAYMCAWVHACRQTDVWRWMYYSVLLTAIIKKSIMVHLFGTRTLAHTDICEVKDFLALEPQVLPSGNPWCTQPFSL